MYARALASGRRLRMLSAIAEHHDLTVIELSEIVGISQPLVSWHLRRLRSVGLVTRRRAGRQTRYSLDPEQMGAHHSDLTRYIQHIAEMSLTGQAMKANPVHQPVSATGIRGGV